MRHLFAKKVARLLAIATAATLSANAEASERIAIVGATLIDGTGRPPIRDSLISVVDGKIEWVGARSKSRHLRGAKIIDARGKFVIPGLVDAHTHIDSIGVAPMDETQKAIVRDYIPLAFLYHGVTSVVNMSAHVPPDVLAKRDQVRADRTTLLPRIYTGAAHFTAVGGWGGRHSGGIKSDAEIEARLDDYAAQRVDLVKIILEDGLGDAEQVFPPLTDKHLHAVAKGSAARGLPVFIHATDDEEYRRAIAAGPRAIVHGLFTPIGERSDIVGGIMKRSIFVVPTIVLFESFSRFLDEPRLLDDPYLAASVPDFILRSVRDPATMVDVRARMDSILKMDSAVWARASVGTLRNNMRLFAQEGVKLAVGTDSGGAVPHAFHGYSTPREVEILADCCMTPMQALVAATKTGAETIGASDLFGTIEPGKSADLLILNADPLSDVRRIRDFDRMMLRGRLIDRSSLSYQSFIKQRAR